MLRPAKLFSPLFQLRHYLENKVAELMQQHPSSITVKFSHATHYKYIPNSLQAIASFGHRHPKAPTLYRIAEQEQQRLLKALQQRVPIVKVFSAPSIVHPFTYNFSFAGVTAKSSAQQFRTIVSSGATTTTAAAGTTNIGAQEGIYAAAGGFHGGGFHYRCTMVGYARTPFAVRQFSTAKSPCITLFQQSSGVSAPEQANNLFSHVSSRFFSPAGTKIGSNGHATSNQQQRMTSSNDDIEDDDDDKSSSRKRQLFPNDESNKGMFELIQDAEHRCPGLVRRVSVATGENANAQKCRRLRRSSDFSGYKKEKYVQPLDYVRHDDLSGFYAAERPESQRKQSVRHWHSSRLKAPPSTSKDKISTSSNKRHVKRLCLSINLDSSAFWECIPSNRRLDSTFIGSLRSVGEAYQMHLVQVIALLQQLQMNGEYEVQVVGSEIRVLLPSSSTIQSARQLARYVLWQVGVEDESELFKIEEIVLYDDAIDEEPSSATTTDVDDDGRRAEIEQDIGEAIYDDIFGPEYFKGIQEFLDHVDNLIEASPAFSKQRR